MPSGPIFDKFNPIPTDINDHRPEFTESVYRIDISENVEEGTEVLQLHATDLDEDKKLFYSLHAAREPISLKLFRVDSVTGSITLAQQLDRELIAEHVLIVIVKDQGTPAKRNYAKVIITVHDHNDHAVSIMPLFLWKYMRESLRFTMLKTLEGVPFDFSKLYFHVKKIGP